MDKSYLSARRKVEELKSFYGHLMAYIIINVFLMIFNFFTTPGFWWFWFITFFWGLGLIAHGIYVVMSSILSKEWEERKIREYMEKEKE